MSRGADAAGWSNPLRDKEDKRLPRIAGPCAMVLFGVTGDLAHKKVVPAVYDLANRGLLPPTFSLVGFARRDWDHDGFAAVIQESVKQHCRTPFRQAIWERLADGLRFVRGEFDDARTISNAHVTDDENGSTREIGRQRSL